LSFDSEIEQKHYSKDDIDADPTPIKRASTIPGASVHKTLPKESKVTGTVIFFGAFE
jgi:hypothetical protein